MKTCIVIMVTLLIICPCTAFAGGQQPKLLVSKLDAKAVTHNLPLTEEEILKSGSGKTKHLWKIKGQQFGHFEVIGDDQNDADNVGWICAEYDKKGNKIKQVGPENFCYQFFVKVLRNIVDQPEYLANLLLVKAKQTAPQSVSQEFGDISIETDGEFYFLRRLSRM